MDICTASIFWLLWTMSHSNFCGIYSGELNIFSILLGKYQFSWIAGLYVYPTFNLVRTTRQFSKAIAPLQISTAMSEDCHFSLPLLPFVTVPLVGFSHPSGCELTLTYSAWHLCKLHLRTQVLKNSWRRKIHISSLFKPVFSFCTIY